MNDNFRPDNNLKFVTPYDIFETIDKCNSKILKVTYCTLMLNNQCQNTKTFVLQIKKIHRNEGFIEGVILKDNKPYEDIILRADKILQVECVKNGGNSDEKPSIFEIIKSCNGLVNITQCTKLEKGKCTEKDTFPFLVTDIDKKNNTIKGYKIKNDKYTKFTVIDASLIQRVECLSKDKNPNFPWSMIPFLLMQHKN
ncbi:MAG: hypothetical protein ACRC92_12005 [Peptostreptococcaceae bacterium]